MEINSGNRDLGTTMCASGYNKDFGFHYQKGGYLELVLTSLSCYLNRFVLTNIKDLHLHSHST